MVVNLRILNTRQVPHLHINVLRVPELVAQHASRGRGVWAPGAPRTAAEALGSAATVTPWHPGPPDVGAAGVKFWAADHCVWLQGAFGTPGLMAQDAMAALAPMASHLACVGIIQAGHQELLLTRAIVSALGATLGRHTHTLCLWGCRLDTAPHGFGQAGWVALLGALPALRVLALRWNMQVGTALHLVAPGPVFACTGPCAALRSTVSMGRVSWSMQRFGACMQ